MDTNEARMQMRDLAHDALAIVDRLAAGSEPAQGDRGSLREMALESRALLGDAGYPAEAAWRGIQRASIGADTQFEAPDPTYWDDVARDLRTAVETLENLVSGPRRDSDVHIIG